MKERAREEIRDCKKRKKKRQTRQDPDQTCQGRSSPLLSPPPALLPLLSCLRQPASSHPRWRGSTWGPCLRPQRRDDRLELLLGRCSGRAKMCGRCASHSRLEKDPHSRGSRCIDEMEPKCRTKWYTDSKEGNESRPRIAKKRLTDVNSHCRVLARPGPLPLLMQGPGGQLKRPCRRSVSLFLRPVLAAEKPSLHLAMSLSLKRH